MSREWRVSRIELEGIRREGSEFSRPSRNSPSAFCFRTLITANTPGTPFPLPHPLSLCSTKASAAYPAASFNSSFLNYSEREGERTHLVCCSITFLGLLWSFFVSLCAVFLCCNACCGGSYLSAEEVLEWMKFAEGVIELSNTKHNEMHQHCVQSFVVEAVFFDLECNDDSVQGSCT